MAAVNDPKSLDAHLKLTSPAYNVVSVVPSDTQELPDGVCKALMVTVAGNLSFVAEGGGIAPSFAVTAGMVIPVRTRQIKSTGTTATVLALY